MATRALSVQTSWAQRNLQALDHGCSLTSPTSPRTSWNGTIDVESSTPLASPREHRDRDREKERRGEEKTPTPATQLQELRRLLIQNEHFNKLQSRPAVYLHDDEETGSIASNDAPAHIHALRNRLSSQDGDTSSLAAGHGSSLCVSRSCTPRDLSGWATPTLISEPPTACPSRKLLFNLSGSLSTPRTSCPPSPGRSLRAPHQLPPAPNAPPPVRAATTGGSGTHPTPSRSSSRSLAPLATPVPHSPSLYGAHPSSPRMSSPTVRKLAGILPPPPLLAQGPPRVSPNQRAAASATLPKPPPVDGVHFHSVLSEGGSSASRQPSGSGDKPPNGKYNNSPSHGSGKLPLPDLLPSVNSSPAPLASPSSHQLQHPASIYRVRPSRFKSTTGAASPGSATPGSATPGHSTPRFGSPPRTPRYPSSSCAGDVPTGPTTAAHTPMNTAPTSGCGEHTPDSHAASGASLASPPASQRHSLSSPFMNMVPPNAFMDMVPPTPFQQLQRQASSRCRDSPTTSRSHSLPHSLSHGHGPYHPTLSPATSVHNYSTPPTPSSHPHLSPACSLAPPAPAPAAPPPPRPPGPLHQSLLLLARTILLAYYTAALFADLEAWTSRYAMHRLRMQRQALTHTHLTLTLGTDTPDGGDGEGATSHMSRLVSALGALLYGALGPGPHVALLHVAVAAPCLAALAAGRWVPEAAALLAGRLLLELLTGHWRGLLLFWRGQSVHLLRVKELAIAGATLVYAARVTPTAPHHVLLAAAAAAGPVGQGGGPGAEGGVGAGRGAAGLPAALAAVTRPYRKMSSPGAVGPSSSGSGGPLASGRLVSSGGSLGGRHGGRPSPASSSLPASAATAWSAARHVARGVALHAGCLMLAPLFAYYGCIQVEHVRDMEGSSLGEALWELLAETYTWVPRGDGSLNTYWLPAQFALALPFFLGLGNQVLPVLLAAAAALEATSCWRFWLRGSVLWSYAFYVSRHFVANLAVAAGLLLTLPAAQVHCRPHASSRAQYLRKKSR